MEYTRNVHQHIELNLDLQDLEDLIGGATLVGNGITINPDITFKITRHVVTDKQGLIVDDYSSDRRPHNVEYTFCSKTHKLLNVRMLNND